MHELELHGPPPPSPGYAYGAAPYRAAPYVMPMPTGIRPKPVSRPFRRLELAALLGTIVVADIALASHDGLVSGGFGAALLFSAIPVALLLAARGWRASLRLGAIAALLALVSVRCAYQPTGGTVVAGLALLAAFAVGLRARRSFALEVAASTLAGIPRLPSRVVATWRGLEKLAARTRLGRISILPIVVPIALCALFAGVFALANPVVAKGLGAAWNVVARTLSLPSIGRVLLWLFVFAGGAALLRPAIRLARGSESATPGADATPTSLLVARNALVPLNLLFLGYNVLDATYLWAGSPPPGVTTQIYAHQGAFWLTVALLMLTVVVGVMFRGALAHDARASSVRTLAHVWAGQGIVLALGTYGRLGMHVARSGLSDLRIVGILGTTLVVCGVVLVVTKLRSQRTFVWLVRRQLDAFFVTAVLYAVTPTHLVSARVNVSRIAAGEYKPLLHMFRQAQHAESAGTVAVLLDHPDIRVRQGVAALLTEERMKLRAETIGNRTWRERDIASARTLGTLDAVGPKIDAVLGTVDRNDARRVLYEISRRADEDRSLEELLAIPSAYERRDTSNAVER